MKEPGDPEQRANGPSSSGEVGGGSMPQTRGARVYDRPARGGRSALTWTIVALVLILLALWLLF
ncbi:MAG TPA: hypothetical protein VF168_01685 [Trueperaceae bacterium]